MDLDDEPSDHMLRVSHHSNFTMAQLNTTRGMTGSEMADEMESEENDAGMAHSSRLSKQELHKMSNNMKPAGHLSVTQDSSAPIASSAPVAANKSQTSQVKSSTNSTKVVMLKANANQTTDKNQTKMAQGMWGQPITDALFGTFKLITGRDFHAQVSEPGHANQTLAAN